MIKMLMLSVLWFRSFKLLLCGCDMFFWWCTYSVNSPNRGTVLVLRGKRLSRSCLIADMNCLAFRSNLWSTSLQRFRQEKSGYVCSVAGINLCVRMINQLTCTRLCSLGVSTMICLLCYTGIPHIMVVYPHYYGILYHCCYAMLMSLLLTDATHVMVCLLTVTAGTVRLARCSRVAMRIVPVGDNE